MIPIWFSRSYFFKEKTRIFKQRNIKKKLLHKNEMYKM